jgi:hypothetical protein
MLQRRDLLRHAIWLPLLAAGTARGLEQPGGTVVLTISGQVRNPNEGAVAQFDMAMLEHLPQASFSTHTPWYSKPRQFTGPLLRDILMAAGARGTLLRAKALNDYSVDIPYDDAQRYDIVVARLLDGAPMRVRDKGPLFVVYPFDSLPELRSAVYYSRSAWQLRSIDVR